jgi:modulator of FtsH protease HflC
MGRSIFGGLFAILAGLALVVGYGAFFTVLQTQQAIVVRLGEPVKVIDEPGLNWKMPFVDSVIFLDKRILDLESAAQEVIASDQRRLVLDAFARYRIKDPLRFFQAARTIERANQQLGSIMNSAVRSIVAGSAFGQVVRDERSQTMQRIRDAMNREAEGFGVEIVDVKIRRADLPDANAQAVFQRMQTERQREAAEFRANGNEQAQRTRARADRDVTVIIADAQSQSEKTRGEGDAERNRIFAEAFGRDPGFFTFYRTMQAYEAGLRNSDTRMVLTPNSDFFRYFGDPSGQTRENGRK